MLDKLSRWFRTETAAPDRMRRPLAMAVLLAETARADFDTQCVERDAVRQMLVSQLGLNDEESQALVARAFAESERSVSLHGFLRTLNDELQPAERRELIEWLWRVAYADGKLDPYEEARVRQLAELLYISHVDFVQTRLAVEQELGISG
ncbi:TerB family tellurite resistance protein [Sinimarinibacterium sp. CAU 1509]|uniref:tellurite resistance TerB family protein n=1 Tax=Sinimarinibacterium sp. CAU 1509 TaxID=2562283 RepID=UPI0010ABFE22|nr:TerB family tellurite resistance protein [Sinimarinibacterium sp. CAU 1509]TJY59342.1 TerB family tellurite resistance protein [Sinimarinibacterium sp. CAU 1509]